MQAPRLRDGDGRRADVLQEQPVQVARADPDAQRELLDADSLSAPSWMSRSARRTTADVPSQAGVPGAASGRQRRQGRYPSVAAAAAVG